MTPGPSHECDITFFVKGRPKSARQSRDSTVVARRVQSVTVPSSRVSRECRSPRVKVPPLCPTFFGHFGPVPFSVFFPFSQDFCIGPVSHSVNGHFNRKVEVVPKIIFIPFFWGGGGVVGELLSEKSARPYK